MYQAYKGELEKEGYYACVKEWINITDEFIKDLNLIAEKAYEYGLLDEQEKVFESIKYIEEEIDSIPIDVDKASWLIEEVIYKEKLKKQIEEAIEKCEEKEGQFEFLLSSLNAKDISGIDYKLYLQRLVLETKTEIYNLTELAKIAKDLGNDNGFKKANEKIATLNSLILKTPADQKEAQRFAKRKKIVSEIKQVMDDYEEIYPKLLHLTFSFSKTTDPNFYQMLYDQIEEAIENHIEKLHNLKPHIKELVDSDEINIVKSFSKEAINLYEHAVKSGAKASEIYQNELFENKRGILTLSKEAYNTWDKGEALELLTKADQLLKTIREVDDYNNEYTHYEKSITTKINNLNTLREYARIEYNNNLDNLDFSSIRNSDPSYAIYSSLIKASISTLLTGLPSFIEQCVQPDDSFLVSTLVVGGTGIFVAIAIKNFVKAGKAMHKKFSIKRANNYNQNSTSSSNSKTYKKNRTN